MDQYRQCQFGEITVRREKQIPLQKIYEETKIHTHVELIN